MSRRPAVIASDRSDLRVWPFIFLGCALYSLWLSWSMKQGGQLLLAMIYALLAGLFFLQARRWRQMHLRRKLAASEGLQAGVPLAQPQPTPNAWALPTPFTITLRPQWFRLLGYMVLLGAALVILFIFVFSLNVGNTIDFENWPFALFAAVLFGAIFAWRFFLPQTIVVYDDGLAVKHPLYDWRANSRIGNTMQAGEHRISWHEARLFAVRSPRPGTPATRYELASPNRVVTFGRARRAHWWALYRPVVPWEHYEFEMDALLDVIAARTGLPLYDVRSGPEQEPAQQLASSRL